MQLTDNEIHLWLTDIESVDGESIAAYRELMNAEERERNDRYRFERGRLADGVTRALVRTTLSRYADVEPTAWAFSKGRYGKPEISGPGELPPLRFNVSHTRRYVVCAVGLEADLGVDIEWTLRRNDVLSIADRFFSELEVRELFELPEHRQHDRFFDYWTLKEAYMKARGEGISLGLGNFSFQWSEYGIGISFTPQLRDDPLQWQFGIVTPKPHLRLAVALKRPPEQRVTVRLFETGPLSNQAARSLSEWKMSV